MKTRPSRTGNKLFGLARSFVAIPVALLILAGCAGGVAPGSPAASGGAGGLALETGVDPESWATVPAGEYLSGQFDAPATLDYDYEIMVTPVTNAQYARYLNEAAAAGAVRVDTGAGVVEGEYPGDSFHGGRHEKEIKAGSYPYFVFGDPVSRISYDGSRFVVRPGYENHPVTMVTWFGARGYAEFYGYRLPTESEWEKAARGVDNRPYPWGSGIGPENANYYHSRDPFERPGEIGDTTPVGFYNGRTYGGFRTADARSPFGLYDMAGNVSEWTADVYEGTHLRYLCGGSKASYGFDLRIWTRENATPEYASPNVGFRCVRQPKGGDVD